MFTFESKDKRSVDPIYCLTVQPPPPFMASQYFLQFAINVSELN